MRQGFTDAKPFQLLVSMIELQDNAISLAAINTRVRLQVRVNKYERCVPHGPLLHGRFLYVDNLVSYVMSAVVCLVAFATERLKAIALSRELMKRLFYLALSTRFHA